MDLVSVGELATAVLMAKRYLFLETAGGEELLVWLAGIGPALLLGQLLMRRGHFEARMRSR